MKPFCRLADPENYLACEWDLDEDVAARLHWVGFFKDHVIDRLEMASAELIEQGIDPVAVRLRAETCRREYCQVFDDYLANPKARGRVTIGTLDTWSAATLHKHGFIDPYAGLKRRENHRMLPLLAAICREVDGLPAPQQLWLLVRGIFAGNIFDMGAKATAERFRDGGVDFHSIIDSLPGRPWLVDDYDRLSTILLERPDRHRKAIFFVDNAGSDFLLGAIPMIRWLAMRGTRVIIAANELPALNDMTASDIRQFWPEMIRVEPSLSNLPISVISTGTGQPLIDLSSVSDDLNHAAADADLVILEGMGRGVESNFGARLNCDSLKIAMLKDPVIAGRIGGKVYDLVLKCEPVN